MTSKTDFTKEEWFLLHSTPTMVGMIVLMVDSSGFFGTTRETVAITKGLVSGTTQFHENALIQALLTEKEGPEGDPVKDSYKELQQELKKTGSLEQMTAGVLESCGQVADLLETKASPQEASGYKAWVMAIADQVASSAKEGSSKGTDRGKVSAAEEALMQKIADALRVEPASR